MNMGQCGCGDVPVENAFKLPSGEVVGYFVYRGCSECFAGPAVDIFVYPNAKSEWVRDAKIKKRLRNYWRSGNDLDNCDVAGDAGAARERTLQNVNGWARNRSAHS